VASPAGGRGASNERDQNHSHENRFVECHFPFSSLLCASMSMHCLIYILEDWEITMRRGLASVSVVWCSCMHGLLASTIRDKFILGS
jgi:hypothetical protein